MRNGICFLCEILEIFYFNKLVSIIIFIIMFDEYEQKFFQNCRLEAYFSYKHDSHAVMNRRVVRPIKRCC